ncbi:MAG: FGGY-family carbohydrate kinase [Candidatus Thiodiazotropha sp.]
MNVYLGIDLGTSGCRGTAIDGQARTLAEHAVPLPPPEVPAPGRSQQDPRLWWQAVRQVLQALARDCRDCAVKAVAVDGTSSSLLLCDPEGRPLTPGLMYNDSRGRDQLPLLQSLAPADSPVLGATSSLAKLLHLQTSRPAVPFHALHQADWIMGRLCGRFDLSDENNCLKLGYDPVQRAWPSWMDGLQLPPGCLPQVLPAGTPIGTLTPAVAAETGLDPATTVVTGTTDANAAFLATGASRIGDAVTSLGRTLVLKILSDQPVFAAAYGIYSHRLGDRGLGGGASNSGGAVCRAYFTDAQMRQLSESIDPSAPTGLDYYPPPAPGERFPVNDSAYPPRLSPRPDSDVRFFQGILEGLTRIEREGYRLLQRLGAPSPRRVISIGGGAVNEPWRRMREAALGVPVVRADRQAAAYGVALLGLKWFES